MVWTAELLPHFNTSLLKRRRSEKDAAVFQLLYNALIFFVLHLEYVAAQAGSPSVRLRVPVIEFLV